MKNVPVLGGDRFRVPIVPCIAIISAYGWLILSSLIKKVIIMCSISKKGAAR